MAPFLLSRRLRGGPVHPDAGGVVSSFLDFHRLHIRDDGDGGVLMVNDHEPLSLGGRPLPLRLVPDAGGGVRQLRLLDPALSPQEALFLFKLCHVAGLLVESPGDGDGPGSFVAIESVHRPADLPVGGGRGSVDWVATPAGFRQALARLG